MCGARTFRHTCDQFFVDRLEHDPHAAASDQLGDFIVAQPAQMRRLARRIEEVECRSISLGYRFQRKRIHHGLLSQPGHQAAQIEMGRHRLFVEIPGGGQQVRVRDRQPLQALLAYLAAVQVLDKRLFFLGEEGSRASAAAVGTSTRRYTSGSCQHSVRVSAT